MVNFRVLLKGTNKQRNSRLKFDLEKLKYTVFSEEFWASLGGMFAPLFLLEEDPEAIINNFTEALTEAAN